MIKQNGRHMVFEEFKLLVALWSKEVDSSSSILGFAILDNHGSCNSAPFFVSASEVTLPSIFEFSQL